MPVTRKDIERRLTEVLAKLERLTLEPLPDAHADIVEWSNVLRELKTQIDGWGAVLRQIDAGADPLAAVLGRQ